MPGPLICEKAIDFYIKLNGDIEFSSGWLKNFKFRNGIREFDIQGERLSAYESASFKFGFANIVKQYEPRNVYNADGTGLLWKA